MQAPTGRVNQSSKIWIFSLLGLAVLIAGSLLAYRFVFHRAGEAAASLIPADAAVVATLDVTPGPDQVVLFGRIAKSLAMDAVQKPIKSSLATSKNGTTFVDEILPHLRASYAVGAWIKPGAKTTDNPAIVGLAAVDSAATVEAIAAKHGALVHLDKLAYYSINSEKLCVAFIKDYLVVSNSPDALARVQAVSRGEADSVAGLASFQEARAKLPSSANFMMFGNMAKAVEWSKKFGTSLVPGSTTVTLKAHSGDPAFKLEGWATFAMTLRNQGLETVWRFPYGSSYPGAKVIGSIAPIDKKLYSRLPAGAYGFFAFAQPGAYYEAKDDPALGLTTQDKKSLDDGLNSFEKETGLSIQKDLVVGLKGNLTLAVYPAREAMTGIPDGLIMLDDANGADPATMITKIKSTILAQSRKDAASAPQFTSVQRDGAVVWSLDEKSQQGLRQTSGLEPRPDPRMPFDGGRSGSAGTMAPKGEKKKLLFATVGKSVLIASSESLLNRAIAAYNTGSSTLETDPAYMPLLKRLTVGAQNVFVVAAPDVMERLKPTMAGEFSDPQGPKEEDVVKLFGSRGNGLVISQGNDGHTLTGNLFFPLDYEAAIHLASVSNHSAQQQGSNKP